MFATKFHNRIHIRNRTGDVVQVGDTIVQPYGLAVLKQSNPFNMSTTIQTGYILTSPFPMGTGPYTLKPGGYYYIAKA